MEAGLHAARPLGGFIAAVESALLGLRDRKVQPSSYASELVRAGKQLQAFPASTTPRVAAAMKTVADLMQSAGERFARDTAEWETRLQRTTDDLAELMIKAPALANA